jgi:hypothetical protein
MSASNAKGILAGASRLLLDNWQQTRGSWHDAKAVEFEDHYIAELQQAMAAALRAIGEIDKLIHQVRSDCE